MEVVLNVVEVVVEDVLKVVEGCAEGGGVV